mgnify:CR=1 FL=1
MPTDVPRARTGRPPRLTYDAIVDAAACILAAEGPQALSMRRLAKELHSAPMTLYHHVRDKDELLLAVLEKQAAAIPRPRLPEDPRERLVAVATVLCELLAERGWIVEVLTADDLFAPSALWFVDTMIGAAIECGCTPEGAVDVYRTIWYYIVGNLIIRVNSARRTSSGARPFRDEAIARYSAERFPNIATVAARWAELSTRPSHREALRAIVDGLLAMHAGGR